MAARQRWVAEAAEVLGAPVTDAVPLLRRRPAATVVDVAGVVVLLTVLYLAVTGAMPGGPFAFLSLAIALQVSTSLAAEPRFAAMTTEGHLWMLTSSRLIARPLALIGPLEPESVSGPGSLYRQTFVISGARHQVPLFHRRRFQDMVDTARRSAVGQPDSSGG